MRRLIIFLIRNRLGLDVGQAFRFANQKSDKDYYFFTKDKLVKMLWVENRYYPVSSHCSLNWILDDNCKIIRSGEYEESHSGR